MLKLDQNNPISCLFPPFSARCYLPLPESPILPLAIARPTILLSHENPSWTKTLQNASKPRKSTNNSPFPDQPFSTISTRALLATSYLPTISCFCPLPTAHGPLHRPFPNNSRMEFPRPTIPTPYPTCPLRARRARIPAATFRGTPLPTKAAAQPLISQALRPPVFDQQLATPRVVQQSPPPFQTIPFFVRRPFKVVLLNPRFFAALRMTKLCLSAAVASAAAVCYLGGQ
jgi:hypothetical protein